MNTKLVNESLLDYIDSHVNPVTECGCWLWEDDDNPSDNVRLINRHIDEFIYRLYREPVPENQELVHTCHLDCCVNPHHLALRKRRR